MEVAWNTKKRIANTAVQKSILVEEKEDEIITGEKFESYLKCVNKQKCRTIGKTYVYSSKSFESWKFGTINIRSGKEKDEGSKI
jgi:hypothetical protein